MKRDANGDTVEQAKAAAIKVLLHNRVGPCHGLPRTAAWGYPEPYTRDMMISALGFLVSGREEFVDALRRVLETLAKNQTRLGHIPSLAHDPDDRGASDTTPLFLFGLAIYRRATGRSEFLDVAAERAMRWMEYQSPEDLVMVAQQPTSDWRDEQWVLGYGLYVNTLVYAYLRLFGLHGQADSLRALMNRLDIHSPRRQRHVHEGLVVRHKPYYALWSFKVDNNERFDLLGNSLAILTGVASPSRASAMASWIEVECDAMEAKGELAVDLSPNLFPFVRPSDPDWRPRYEQYNLPGEYHNGGIWPFVSGFHVAALVAAGRPRLAKRKLLAMTELVRPARKAEVTFGFNEWIKAQDGTPRGQDWQTWSAAMYVYAATCVERSCTPFFDEIRNAPPNSPGRTGKARPY
ncbi:MAG: amylo-alpha-1,6-glucosidase [Phycisphaerae bacterium]|nr:amylo-alpha-1,6-glucosidase [Phycisphaerae bacterium]